MRTNVPWKKAAVLAALAAGAMLADGGTPASAQVIYEQAYAPVRYKVKYRGFRARRGVAMMPVAGAPAYVTPTTSVVTTTTAPLAVSETRYVTSSPVVQSVYTPAPVVGRSFVVPSAVVPAQYVVPTVPAAVVVP